MQAIPVVALDIADDQVQTIHAVANPEKLQHLDRTGGIANRTTH